LSGRDTPEVVAAAPGFEFGDLYALGLVFVGFAVIAALVALSHQHERAFSASLIYLVLGLGAAAAVELLDVHWLDPVDDAELIERPAEFCVIVALFSTGLKLDREQAVGVASAPTAPTGRRALSGGRLG
jgi:hypothetical protein